MKILIYTEEKDMKRLEKNATLITGGGKGIGFFGKPGQSSYAAAKEGIRGLKELS